MDKYKTLAANTALISIGTFASKFLLFFMVRFYTAYLSPADYGTADLITQTANLVIPLVSFGITDGVFRFAMDNPALRKNVFSSGILVITAGGCFLLGISLVLYPLGHLNQELVLIMLYALCSCIHSLCAQFIRGQGRMQMYAIQGILNTAFLIALNILFLAGMHLGIVGYVIAVAIADLLCTVFLVCKERLWQYVTWKPDLKILRSMLKYSIPMIPTTIFWWITSVSDRYMIRAFIDSEANGMYTIACKIPTIMTLLAGIFMEAWQFSAVMESQGDTKERDRFFSRIWEMFQAALLLSGSLLISFAKPEIMILAAKEYFSVWQYVPVLCVASAFSAFSTFMGSIYLVEKKSGLYFWTSLFGALVNIALNLVLIPSPLGVQGAAIATLCSYIVMFLVRVVSARRMIPLQMHAKKLILGTVLVLIQSAIMVMQLPGWLIVQILCPLLLFLMYRGVVVATAKRVLKEGRNGLRRR